MGKESTDTSIVGVFAGQQITIDRENLGRIKKAVEHNSSRAEVTNEDGDKFGKILNFDVEERQEDSVILRADVGWYGDVSNRFELARESQQRLTSAGLDDFGEVELHLDENVNIENDFNDSRTVHSPESERIELIVDEELSTEADKILESRNVAHRRKTELGLVIYSITISNIHHIAVAIILLHWYFIQGDNEPGEQELAIEFPNGDQIDIVSDGWEEAIEKIEIEMKREVNIDYQGLSLTEAYEKITKENDSSE